MKKLIFVILLSVLLTSITARPKMKFQKQYLVLDSLYVGIDSVPFTIQYTNIGTSPLYLTKVSPFCHCIKMDDNDEDVLLPGDTSFLTGKIRINTVGELRKPIKIYYTGGTDTDNDYSDIITLLGTVFPSK